MIIFILLLLRIISTILSTDDSLKLSEPFFIASPYTPNTLTLISKIFSAIKSILSVFELIIEEKIEELKAGFTSQFAEREEEFSNALQAIIGASNFIADELETQISEFVLSLASGIAGMRIDEIPAPFSKKISEAAKQIAGNDDELKVYLNSKDFKILTEINFDDGLQYTFHAKENLKRGEFEVLSAKSSARVSLFDLAVGD